MNEFKPTEERQVICKYIYILYVYIGCHNIMTLNQLIVSERMSELLSIFISI